MDTVKANQKKRLNHNQEGIVAIVVTIIFLVVISLTALGLARLARREQRQALDNQLATQALYLAQAGINDAMEAIKVPPYSSSDRTSCDQAPISAHSELDFFRQDNPTANPYANQIRGDLGNISISGEYSCVLISHNLPTIQKPAPTNTSSVIDTGVIGAGGPYNLIIGWSRESSGPSDTFRTDTGNTDFPTSGAWGSGTTGVLRADITDTSSLSRASLENTMTAFLYPHQQGAGALPATPDATFSGAPNQRARIVSAHCHSDVNSITNQKCNAVINIPSGGDRLIIRLKSVYSSSKVTIAALDPAGNRLRFTGQILIDSTGKVADVVKRLQVRINKSGDSEYPEYAIESVDAICKLLQTQPSSTSVDPGKPSGRDGDACTP